MRIGGGKTFGFCPRIIGKYFFAHELHESARMFPNDKMATGSVARIYTNAMRVFLYDDNGINLRQLEVVLGAIGNELIFAHELLGNIFLPTNCTN